MFINDALVYDTTLDECPSWSRATHAELEDEFRWNQDVDPDENEPGELTLFHVRRGPNYKVLNYKLLICCLKSLLARAIVFFC